MRKLYIASPAIIFTICVLIFMLYSGPKKEINHRKTSHPNDTQLRDILQKLSDYQLDTILSSSGREIKRKARTSIPSFWFKNRHHISYDHLIHGAVPAIVHYFWCGEHRWFEFKHYLSVLSVLRTLQPDQVVIHYEFPPEVDQTLYNLWLDDLKQDFQFLIVEEMTEEQKQFCSSGREAQLKILFTFLMEKGGLYLSENTWFLNFPPKDRNKDVISALNQDLDGFLMLRPGLNVSRENTSLNDLAAMSSVNSSVRSCTPIHHIYRHTIHTNCVVVRGGAFDSFFPMNIWELDDPFGRLVRSLFYDTEEILQPKPSYDTLVPNIGHMIWIGGGEMDFVFYLSILSVLFVANVDVVYLHGDKPPAGIYWHKLQSIPSIKDRIRCIRTTQPSMVYQGVIEPWYRALMSDIIRVDLMIKYGGIYTDTDAIWVKPLSYVERGFEAVACFDWVDWSYPYPDSVNFGISYGKKNAPFWRLFRESMRNLHNEHHGFTGVMYPYKLLEKYPDLLRIDKRLSVICYHSRCHPIWVKNYHDMANDHVTSNSIPDWRNDVHAFHWTYPNPEEYKNESTLMASKGIFAEIGKNVLSKAGLL